MSRDQKKNLHYDFVMCSAAGCSRLAVTGRDRCWEHLSDKEEFRDEILSAVRRGENLKEYVLENVNFSGADLSGGHLGGAVLNRANLTDSRGHANFENADRTGIKQ